MIADSSLSSAFDDLADLFLGSPVAQPTAGDGAVNDGASPADACKPPRPPAPLPAPRPVAVEGLVLGHLPMLGSLWAGQYPRMVAAAENTPVALVRLDGGSARVEVFRPPTHRPAASAGDARLRHLGNGRQAHRDRPCPDLAGALSRAASTASRIIICSSVAGDELLLAASGTVGSMAVLTGADDASAVGAYKAIKRLAGEAASGRARSVSIAVMGSDEQRASAVYHRLADAAGSFLSIPLRYGGHCRQIAGGVPGAILFEGPSAMTTQAVLEALARPMEVSPNIQPVTVADAMDSTPGVLADIVPPPLATAPASPPAAAVPPSADSPVRPAAPVISPGPLLGIDADGTPQVVAGAAPGASAAAVQSLLAVGAWLWESRELLAMVCPAMRMDAEPILHLVTDQPVDVKRLVNSKLRLHVRAEVVARSGTMALN